MGLLRRTRFTRTRAGTYKVRLDQDERALLATLPDQLEALLTTPADDLGDAASGLVRLFPPAYVEDKRRDREYQRLMHDELVRSRLASVSLVRSTLESPELTEDQLQAWVRVLNDIRLILGTMLDVSEDTDVLAVDAGASDASQRVVYYILSGIVEEAVWALSEGLPAPAP